MPLQPGTRLGHYDVTALIGEGGMGQVWQATDTKLNRAVALKILPDAFAADPDRLARFQREAQVLASLNHPNIAQIYGIEEAGPSTPDVTSSVQAVKALVLELVEGPTLADRIAHGALPLEDALPIARQIAEALEAAHEAGVIHRDLKPANIKVREDGTVKVLDFGLAKALDPTPTGDPSQSPTLTAAATQMGVIMGTAAYMSPEQARGKPVDRRADIWAFGCVLFEMLTGGRAFGADEVSDTLAFVLTKDLDWNALPTDTPAPIRHLLRRCMDKDARRRLRDIGEARLVVEDGWSGFPWRDAEVVPGGRGRGAWRAVLPWAVAGVATLIALVANWPGGPAANPPSARFQIPVSGELPLRQGHLLALSPDGRELVYRAGTEEGDQLYRRPLNSLEAVPIRGSESAANPFFSPDGQSLAFTTPDGLKKVSLAGGLPIPICACSAFAGTWGADGTIVFSDSSTNGLARVSSAGGVPEPVTTPRDGEVSHQDPTFLPGGDAVLFMIWSGSLDTAQIAVVSLQTGQRTSLGNGFFPLYSATGHVIYAQTGATMWAAPFDESSLETTGAAVPVLEGVRIEGAGSVQFSLSKSGSIAYIRGGMAESARTLVWVGRDGDEEPLANAEARAYTGVQMSPDGARVVLEVEGTESLEDLWVYDVVGETTTQLTFDPAADMWPLWTPDSQHVVWYSEREGPLALFRRRVDGTGQAANIAPLLFGQLPYSITPDGEILLYQVMGSETGWDIGRLSLVGDPGLQPLLAEGFGERQPRISPDGRWLAYTSDQSGEPEVFVMPFPDVQAGGPWRVPRAGGEQPVWSPDGREIYYRQGSTVWAASVETSPAFVTTDWRELFSGPYRRATGFHTHTYDIAPDGERFLMIRESESEMRGSQIRVVQNWVEELRRLLASN